jgi:hypothetical protein
MDEFGGRDWRTIMRWLSENTVDVEPTLTGEITFGDGTPVISTLEILQSQVADLFREFSEVFNPNSLSQAINTVSCWIRQVY